VIDRHINEEKARRQQARMSPAPAAVASQLDVMLLLYLLLLLAVFIVMVLAPSSRSLTAFRVHTNATHAVISAAMMRQQAGW